MIIDRNGDIAWLRASTELPPGKTVAELWDEQVREQLDLLLATDQGLRNLSVMRLDSPIASTIALCSGLSVLPL